MDASIQQAYDALPPDLQQAVDRIIAALSQQDQAHEDQWPVGSTGPWGRGAWKGKVWMADDFNAPLDDLKEYMP